MKVTGETFSFTNEEEKPKKQDTTSIQTSRQKDRYRTELWRALYKKAPTGQFLNIGNKLTEFAKKKFPNYKGRIFQVKGQSKNSNVTTIFTLSFFY